MPAHAYPSSWSRGLLWTTLGSGALLAAAAAVLVSRASRHGAGGQAALLGAAALLCLTFLASAALSPRGCEVGGAGVTIRQLLRRVRIARSELVQVELLGPEAFDGALRTFGIGGLFGYVGRYRLARHGPCRLYATRLDRGVALHTSRGLVVVTPDDAPRFAAEVAALAEGPAGRGRGP